MGVPADRRRSGALAGAAAAAAGLSILAFTGVLPPGWGFVFKPLTTVLIVVCAWPRGAGAPRRRGWTRVGLLLSLAGDVALLWPDRGFLPGLVAFLLAHLAYIAAFSVPVRLAARPLGFAGYALVAATILAALWGGVPAALRVPVVAYVIALATMAAQAFAWWRSSVARAAPDLAQARLAALGGALFMGSDALLAINRFGVPLTLAPLWILSTYWLAQGCIAASLGAAPREAG